MSDKKDAIIQTIRNINTYISNLEINVGGGCTSYKQDIDDLYDINNCLSDSLLNLVKKINNNSASTPTTPSEPELIKLCDMTKFTGVWNGRATIENNKLVFDEPTGSRGIQSVEIKDTRSGFVKVEFDIDSYEGVMHLMIGNYKKESTNLEYDVYKLNIQSLGPSEYIIDLNNLSQYSNYDLSKPIYVSFFKDSQKATKVTFNYINVYDYKENSQLTEALENKLRRTVDGVEYEVYTVNGVEKLYPVLPNNIVFVGNSLLLGTKNSFGLAATNNTKDYYALINNHLKEKGITPTCTKVPIWEFENNCDTSIKRTTWFNSALSSKLNDDVQLVILQYGDNFSEERVLDDGSEELINYVKEHAPNARVAVVGTWFGSMPRRIKMRNACKETDAIWIDIGGLFGNTEYEPIPGSTITCEDGTTTTVAANDKHPNDAGMQEIANRIIEKVF